MHMQGARHFNSFRYPTHTNLHAHGMKLVPMHLSHGWGMRQCMDGRGAFSEDPQEMLLVVIRDESQAPGNANAGVWMYGGVPDISQTTVPYINHGDNIFFDVSPVCLLVSKLSDPLDGLS